MGEIPGTRPTRRPSGVWLTQGCVDGSGWCWVEDKIEDDDVAYEWCGGDPINATDTPTEQGGEAVLTSTKDAVLERDKQIASLKHQLAEARKTVSWLDGQHAGLVQELAEATDLIRGLEDRVREARGERDTPTEQGDEPQTDQEWYSFGYRNGRCNAEAQAEEEITSLKSQLAEAREAQADEDDPIVFKRMSDSNDWWVTTSTKKQIERRIASLRKQLALAQDDASEWRKTAEHRLKSLDDLTIVDAKKWDKIQDLKCKLSDEQKLHSAKQALVNAAEDRVSVLEREVEQAEQTIATLREWVSEQPCEATISTDQGVMTCLSRVSTDHEDQMCKPCRERARAAQEEE